jgi:hypothetical protein
MICQRWEKFCFLPFRVLLLAILFEQSILIAIGMELLVLLLLRIDDLVEAVATHDVLLAFSGTTLRSSGFETARIGS